MSLTLNMVGGGGGGLSATDALLRVQAPAGSTVTISKGTTTKTDLGHENADRPTIYNYYFIIHQSQFDSENSWTVTATRSTDSNSKTIIIDASDEYDVSIGYHVPLETYQEVEYLASTSSQYIDSGFKANGSTEFEVSCYLTGSRTGVVFGSREAWNKNNFNLSTWDGLSFQNGTSGNVPSPYHYDLTSVWNTKIDISLRNGILTTSMGDNITTSLVSFTNPANVVIYALRDGDSISEYLTGRIYSLKFWSGSTLIREFYPCYRLSDSVAGLYDKENDVFYTNNGSGTFTVGADV